QDRNAPSVSDDRVDLHIVLRSRQSFPKRTDADHRGGVLLDLILKLGSESGDLKREAGEFRASAVALEPVAANEAALLVFQIAEAREVDAAAVGPGVVGWGFQSLEGGHQTG